MTARATPALRAALCAPCAALLLLACDGAPEPPGRPMVVVSVLPQRYFVEQLAGDAVEVEVMIPPGASPALYEPSLAQLRALGRARAYVAVGHPSFPFERAWLDRLLAEGKNLRVVNRPDPSRSADAPGDPHVWVAPGRVRGALPALAAALAEIAPESADRIRARQRRFDADIARLQADLEGVLGPHRGKRFFVFHPAFGHLAAEYGLVQVAVEREGKEPGPSELRALIESARQARVRTLFVQPQFDRQSAQAIARDVGAQIEVLDPLAYDWAENLRRVADQLAAALVP